MTTGSNSLGETESAATRALRIVESMPAFAWSADPAGRFTYVGPSTLAFLGSTPDDLNYSPDEDEFGWRRVVHPDDYDRVAARWRHCLQTGDHYDTEHRLRRADGVYRWFRNSGRPSRDGQGNITAWYGTTIDIEEQKQVEAALRDRERELSQLINMVPSHLWRLTPDGEPIFFNKRMVDFLGLDVSDMDKPGMSRLDAVIETVHPDDAAKFRDTLNRCLLIGESFAARYRLRRADGVYRWMSSRAEPMRDQAGRIVQWYGLCRDIDDQMHAEKALRRSEAFLAEGQHLARMGNFSWRFETGEIVWSGPLYRIFEFDPGTVVTLDLIATRVHPEDLHLMRDMNERAQRGESDFEYQHRIVLPDQSVKYLHIIAHGTRDKDGRLEYVGAVQDVTRRRLSEEALAKARSDLAQVTGVTSLGAMTASVAHEVNQPLSGIITNAGTCLRMLAADPPNIEVARETAQRTIRDGNRAAAVIARLRALFSKRAALIEPVDLNEAAREVIALSWSDLQRSRVVLRTELADGLPLVGGDRVQLQQVLMNLLRNAADAMSSVDDRPRLLVVRTEPDDEDNVRLSVEDAGIGFGPQGAERLFEAFYTTKTDGMGIGLSVSRSIIERHNGRLWAQANDGAGVTFSFSMPRYSGDEDPLHRAEALHAPVAGHAQSSAGIS